MATKNARMLHDHRVDGIDYRCNDAVEFPESVCADLVNQGAADDNEEAVAYALTIGELKHHPSSARVTTATPLIDLIKKPIADIVERFPALTADDLEKLVALDEEDGKPRKGLTEAIADELQKRAAPPVVQASAPLVDNPDPAANE